MKQKYFLLVCTVSIFVTTFGQNGYDRRDMLKLIDTTLYNNFKTSYPIVRDTLNQFPDSLIVEGEIADYITGVSCGVFCGSGALKIKLTKANAKYAHDFLFIGVPCFSECPDTFKTRKIWTVSKISLTDHSCYWTEVPVNKFDSKGTPFYTIKN